MYIMIYTYQVLELEETKGEWGFKALKQMIKLHFKLVGILLLFQIIANVYYLSIILMK